MFVVKRRREHGKLKGIRKCWKEKSQNKKVFPLSEWLMTQLQHRFIIQLIFNQCSASGFWWKFFPPEHPKLLKTFHSFVSYFPLLIHNEQQCEEKCKFFMAKTDSRDGFESSNKARFSLADGLKVFKINKFFWNRHHRGVFSWRNI